MTDYDFDTAYDVLMSAAPYSQSSASAMLRNFGTGARLMAAHLRSGGATANSGAGDSGVAAQEQAERHAQWFDQVASNSSEAADKLDALAKTGNEHQATAESIKASFDQAVAADSQAGASGGQDMAVIHHLQSGQQVMNASIEDWGSAYGSFKAPAPPPVPSAGGSHGAASGAPSGGSSPSGGTSAPPDAHYQAPSVGPAHVVAGLTTGGLVVGGIKTVAGPGPGSPGSVEVGPDGGEFAGWFKDPRTGYYIDPSTGREFDPVTNRWIDPVTGLPFGDVTQYSTGLQGIGPASTTGGLLADTSATVGTSAAGLGGAGGVGGVGAGGFAGLFTGVGGGNTAAIAGAYGGMLPPSLTNGSAATGSLWQEAGRNLGVRQHVATSLLAREQAVRAGRPYMPPNQAGLGASAGGGRGGRPGYLTADEEEAGLFSSRGARAGSAAAGAEAEEAEGGVAGRRAYLPATQAGAGKDEKKRGRNRPDWLVDDDVFSPDTAPTGVLGE